MNLPIPFLSFIGTMHLGSLSVSKAVETLRPWSVRWINVAEILQVPSEVISKIGVIATGKQSEDSALYKVVEWWFKNSPNPEWTAILRVESMMCNDDTSYQMAAYVPRLHMALGQDVSSFKCGMEWSALMELLYT